MLREVKPKNPRTARILKKKEPKLIEPTKRTLLLHGTKCPVPLNTLLKTFHGLTNPNSVLFHKKNDNIRPFENTDSIEFLAGKNECGIVVYGSSNKKRPNCITLARIYNAKVLEMFELLLLPGSDGDAIPAPNALKFEMGIGMKPMVLFAGSIWEDNASGTYAMIKSVFLDIFKGEETDKIDVEGLQFLMMVAAEEPAEPGLSPIVHLRWYKTRTKRSGHKLPRVELEEIGPKFDFKVGRVREADPNLMKEAMKQGKRPNEEPRTKKNISMDIIGDKVGRVHLGKQDLANMQTRKMKGLKRRAGVDTDSENDDEPSNYGSDVSEEIDFIDEDAPSDVDMMDVDEGAGAGKGRNKKPKLA
ncbi:putative ribosome biogenesis protein [Talaromyces proteolyticus]|uniref:Ribosome production factor 2 homolog n=1 Tax=Talaromyces proteolyticus TaxID=1131652 RepID=A0AAD4KZJ6_9EURO|nr:putative ribosome biogenesis protein [Talaromyces proteolyticus]KAH8700991.1 putative ribosome biogenesis protein [Talaromyces proteolyticus]